MLLSLDGSARYQVGVRELCEFAAKRGDLDLRFTPSPTAQEGIAGHALVAARRPAGYQSEVALSGQHGLLTVKGRADGYDTRLNRVEEFKTHKGPVAAIPANHRHLHWAQAKVYGALLCREHGLDDIDVALVYFEVGSQQETVLCERHTASDLDKHFATLCERFAAWAEQELRHRQRRDDSLTAMTFVHPRFRAGQRELAESVYKATATGRCLLAQAPTGIGKTLGTVFPMLKACPTQGLDKVYFLTAKTSGRAAALHAIAGLRAHHPSLRLRELELRARDKACEHPDRACHGQSCPLARGFYDRLPAARAQAVATEGLTHEAVRAIALAHEVCPYYLSQELVRWADVVVGDYNHYFDQTALLHGLMQQGQWRVGVLVDEAHNLVERGRGMHSCELHQSSLQGMRHRGPAALKKPLDRLHRTWQAINKAQLTSPLGAPTEASTDSRIQAPSYRVLPEMPSSWLQALQQLCAAIGDHMAEHPTEFSPELQSFYFACLQMSKLADSFGSHSLFDWAPEANATTSPHKLRSTLCIRNVLPAPFLTSRLSQAHSVTLFSATLQPTHFFETMLGTPDGSVAVDVASPFSADQLEVKVARHISTRFADRARSRDAMVALMAEQFHARPGNYLAFFSSHGYLQDVADHFERTHPDVPTVRQQRGMSEEAQRAFLARMTPTSQGIGFAVLGGSFSEGVDLPGQRLIGAFIATLGLPQVNPVNEHLKARLDEIVGDGHAFHYLYPGLQKVVQAAGRVIRTTQDQGVVHLLDDRYGRAEVRALLPRWWDLEPVHKNRATDPPQGPTS
jgi:DNA excision repair protein ERCC-2